VIRGLAGVEWQDRYKLKQLIYTEEDMADIHGDPRGAEALIDDGAAAAGMPVPDRILLAAKELIARKGPVGTTVRDICDASEVNVASIHYYYGSKEALVKSVLLAVLEPVNIERRVRLEEARRQFGSAPIPVPVILEALLRPLVACERAADGGRLFVRMENHLRAVPDSDYTIFVSRHLDGYAQMFIDALAATLPQFTRTELIWRYEFVRGSAMHLLANCDPLSQKFKVLAGTGAMVDLQDNELILRELLVNALLGLSAPAAWTDRDIGQQGG
jgi:AcrR family transcriptional regulator